MSSRFAGRVAIAWVGFVLCGSYLWLALHHGSWWLDGEIIHENGRLTLGQTIFYFEHFLREWPVDVAMALFGASTIRAVFTLEPRRSRSAGAAAGAAAAGLVALAWVVATDRLGSTAAFDNAWQRITRDDVAGHGAHWHAHWLQVVWFGCVSGLISRSLAASGARLELAAWAFVALTTAIFGLSTDTFTSAWYLGHQAREVATHAIVTLPLLAAAAVYLAKPAGRFGWRWDRTTSAYLMTVVGIPLFLAIATLARGGAGEVRLSGGWAGAVAGHIFEHMLDYLLVLLLTVCVAGLTPGRTRT